MAAGAFAFGAALPADAALLPDDFVPVVAPDLAGAFATAAFEAVGLGSGLSVAFAAGAFEEAAFGLLAALAGVVALGLAALVSVCFAAAGAALGLAAALGFAGDALPLPVAPVLAGSWAVALADGVGSSIAFAAGAAFGLLFFAVVDLLVVVLVVVLATSILLERIGRYPGRDILQEPSLAGCVPLSPAPVRFASVLRPWPPFPQGIPPCGWETHWP